MPLLEAIRHVASVRGSTDHHACHELRIALREGAVKSRYYGMDSTTLLGRDEGIAPAEWYRSGVLPDGSVIFNYDGRFDEGKPILDPTHPAYLPASHVEVWRADVLRFWRERNHRTATGKSDPRPTAHTIDGDNIEPTEAAAKSRQRRRNEKRGEIRRAILALRDESGWDDLSDKDRCNRVEDYLGKRKGWCTVITFRRAIAGVKRS